MLCASHQRCVSSCTPGIFVGRADFACFVRFDNSARCISARHVLALATLSVCLCCRTLIGTYLAFCRLMALCYTVLCCACGTTMHYSYIDALLSACLLASFFQRYLVIKQNCSCQIPFRKLSSLQAACNNSVVRTYLDSSVTPLGDTTRVFPALCGLIALRCAVLCLQYNSRCSTTTCSYMIQKIGLLLNIP